MTVHVFLSVRIQRTSQERLKSGPHASKAKYPSKLMQDHGLGAFGSRAFRAKKEFVGTNTSTSLPKSSVNVPLARHA